MIDAAARQLIPAASPETLAAMLAQLHPTQGAHAIAASALDCAREELYKRTRDLPTSTDEELEAWDAASEAARAELKIDALTDALVEAEDALLRWSFAVARRTLADRRGKAAKRFAADVLMIDALEGACFGTAPRRFRDLRARAKSIDIALRLDPAAAT